MDKVLNKLEAMDLKFESKFDTLKLMITILTVIVSISIALGTILKFFN